MHGQLSSSMQNGVIPVRHAVRRNFLLVSKSKASLRIIRREAFFISILSLFHLFLEGCVEAEKVLCAYWDRIAISVGGCAVAIVSSGEEFDVIRLPSI